MPDAHHLLHKQRPFVRSKEEAEAYLCATFPRSTSIIRAGDISNAPGKFVGVGGAFGAGPSWDSAIAHLMSDDMIHLYVEP